MLLCFYGLSKLFYGHRNIRALDLTLGEATVFLWPDIIKSGLQIVTNPIKNVYNSKASVNELVH